MNKKRDLTIDFLRGSAVLLMIITHVNSLFDGSDNYFLDRFTFTGATICFSTFLFCSSAIYGLKLSRGNLKRESSFKRVSKIVIVYYLLALFVTVMTEGIPSFRQVIGLFVFEELPIFIEFLLAFALFDIFTFLFQRPIKKLLNFPVWFLLGSIGIYFLSRFLYQIDLGDNYFSIIKSLLVGHKEIHSFGILSYFPIYALGLVWGKYLIGKEYSSKIALIMGVTAYTVMVGMKSLGYDWERWSPSVVFHLYGLAFIGIMYFSIKYLLKVKYLSNYFVYMSRNTLEYYYIHVLVIFGISMFFTNNSFGTVKVVVTNIVVFSICTLLVFILKSEKFKMRSVSK